MRSQVARIGAPFSGGVVTSRSEDRLDATQTAELENAILVDGVAQERNGYAPYGTSDPFGALVGVGFGVLSGRFWSDEAQEAERLALTGFEVVAATGGAGLDLSVARLSGSAEGDEVAGPFAIEEYAGEVILAFEGFNSRGCAESLRRWAGAGEDQVGSDPGSFSVTAGIARAVGSGSGFLSSSAVNAYLDELYRVAAISSDTQIGLHGAPDISRSTISATSSELGRFGIKSLVTSTGVTSCTGGTTVTGKGTRWLNGAPGSGPVFGGDIILLAAGDALTAAVKVLFVNNDEQLTLASNPGAKIWTDQQAYILRPLVGECIAAHRGRLFVAGVQWAGDRLQILPQGYDLSHITNGLYSPLNDAARASEVESVEVPNPTATGRIVALASHEAGLVIVRSGEVYLGRNEWPGMSFDRIGQFGCLNRGGCLAARSSVFIAGPGGVWHFDGDLRELSAPRDTEWRELVTSDVLSRTVVGYADDHLFVVGGDAATGAARMWIYDLQRRVWVGDATNEVTTGIPQIDEMRFMFSRSGAAGDVLLGFTGSTAANQRTAVDLSQTVRVDDGGKTTVHTGRGRFMGVLPPSAAGSSSLRKRVVGAKVSYAMDADSGTLDVAAAVDNSAFTAESSLPVNASTDDPKPLTARVRPSSGRLGVSGRNHRIRLQRAAGAASVRRLAIHEVELNVRESRARA